MSFSEQITKQIWQRVFRGTFILVLLSMILPVSALSAMQLVAAEYYVNTDPGAGNGTAIASSADGSFDTNTEGIEIDISAGNYTEGTHTVYVRFKDADGNWGIPKGILFTIKEPEEFIYELAEAEYFIDTDPGEGMGTSISGTFSESTETLNFDVSASGLAEGQHKIYVRFKDANGKWGSPRGQVFNVSEQADFTYSLTKGEYFIDTDPGEGNGTPINTTVDGSFDGTEESVELDVNLNSLTDGAHIVYTRFQDNTGSWGAKKGFQFMVQSSEEEELTIETAEYFIDTDPGEGAGTPIAAPVDGAFDEAVEELEATFTLSNLPVGQHYAYFRVKGSNGKWGPARGVPFKVENIAIIDRAEYFFNSDPGEGNGTPISAATASDGVFNSTEEVIDLDIDIPDTGLAEGQHTMYIRFRNSKGEWSQPSSKNFTIQTKPTIVVSTDTLEFGEHVVGDSLAQTFTVGNDGDGELNITNITSSSSEFTVSETTGSIPANSDEKLTFTVSYEPTSAGDKNAVLTITNNDQNKTIRLLGSALAKEPIMEISASSLDYGTVLVGDSVSKYVAIYNTGYDTLNLTDISVNSGEFSVSPTTGMLPPQSSLTDSLVINVAMVPDTEGSKTGTLSLAGNVTTQQVSLSGTAELNPEPTIVVSTDSLAFSAVEIGKDSVRTLQIRNLGTNALTISGFNLSGSAFSTNLSTPVDVERGTPLNVPITFSPTTASVFTGTVAISSNDAVNGSVEVKLSGEGTTGPPTRILAVNPTSLNFGQVTQSDTAKQVLSLSNEGNSTLKVTVIASDVSDFFVENGPTPSNPLFIPAESARDVEISFSPSSGGEQTFTGELSISSDRTDTDEVEKVAMTGVGVDEPTPNIQLSTRTLNYGELRLNNTASMSFTVTNGGNAELVVSSVTVNNSAFSITSPSSVAFTLQQGQEQAFEVAFTPQQVQSYVASLILTSNIDPVSIDLLGEGVTLSSGVDSTQVRSNDTPVASGQAVPVTINPTGLGENGSAYLYYKTGGGGAVSSYTKSEMQRGPSGTYSGSIPSNVSTERGISYWFEVTDGSETITSPESNPHLNPYSIMVEVPDGLVRNSPQPAGSEQNFYRMISVPLTGTSGAVDTVLKNFGTGDEETWRLFRWQSGSYVEHSESNFESFAPGRAYWFITTTAASIQSGSGTTARTDQPFSIFLQPGWNMIGSPFTYPTSWANAEKPDGIENLWAYDGSGFINSAELIPWVGYFVNNTSNNPAELKLSPVESSGSAKENAGTSTALTFDDEQGWAIHINAASGIVRDEYNYLGVQPKAEDGLDSFDFKDAPKQPGQFLQLGFLDEDNQKLAVDFRAPTVSGHYWDFEILTNTNASKINLDISAIGELPSDFQMQLIDKDQQTLWNLDPNEIQHRSIRSAMGDTLTRKFRLVVGTEAFINFNNLGIEEHPETFVLKHNYPNPFNPSTTIVFGLPEAADVTLEIYNAIGRKVATIINERMDAGYHDFIWDASGVASGVYFYRMKAQGNNSKSTFTKIQKMTLIK